MPGDVISIKLGDIVAADARLLEGDPLKIDQVRLRLLPKCVVYCLEICCLVKLKWTHKSSFGLCSLLLQVSPFL